MLLELLEFIEDGLMVVFIIGLVDGVIKEYPSTLTLLTGLGIIVGTILIM